MKCRNESANNCRSRNERIRRAKRHGTWISGNGISGTTDFVNCSCVTMVEMFSAQKNDTIENKRSGNGAVPRGKYGTYGESTCYSEATYYSK